MNLRVLGVYREAQFSPGKVDLDAAILDAALRELRAYDADTFTIEPARFGAEALPECHAVLAMCQSETALAQLAALEQAGAVAINSALAIRNCYRDLLGAGLMRAGVPIPEGAVMRTDRPDERSQVNGMDLSAPMFVKRGDLHALGDNDVQRVEGREQLERVLLEFFQRGIATAYVQQAVAGEVVKFYGVSGGELFAAVPETGAIPDSVKAALFQAASTAANTLGLEVWGGDAVVADRQFSIIDFNDWPSFSRVREQAARAIARRAILLMRRNPGLRALGA